MSYLVSLLTLLLLTSPGLTQSVVLDAKPAVKVESDEKLTRRVLLSGSEQEEYRVLIIKKGGRYFWASRENRELLHQASGAFHYFTDPRGGGYIKIFDAAMVPDSMRDPGRRFRYVEHLTLWLGTITYWGAVDRFEP